MKILHSVIFYCHEPKKCNLIEEKFFPTKQEARIFLEKEKRKKINWTSFLAYRSCEDERAIKLLEEGRTHKEALELYKRAVYGW